MENTVVPAASPRVTVPVVALSLYAVASGYLMSLIPLMLGEYNISADYASWLASVFYGGLLTGAILLNVSYVKLVTVTRLLVAWPYFR